MSQEKIYITKEEIPNKRELPKESVEESVKKEWKTLGSEEADKLEKKVAKKKSKKNMTKAQLRNLVQYRDRDELSEDAKRRMLSPMRVKSQSAKYEEDVVEFPKEILEPDKLREVLLVEEQRFFVRRWGQYMDEHQGDFNRAEDYDTVVELILCYVHEFRILKKMKNSPSLAYDKNVDQVMHNLHNRISNLRRDLKTRRKDRIESKESRQSQFLQTVTEIAKSGKGKGVLDEIERRMIEQNQMEEDMISRKMDRESGNTEILS